MSVTTTDAEVQQVVVLTAHPLQRVGAYALTALAGCRSVEELTPDGFGVAVSVLTRDAVEAAGVVGTKEPGGFWLKTSMSFFPNSKMNHPLRFKQSREQLAAAVAQWRTMPAADRWPAAVCALCARQAVGFYGKMDVALAESVAYRNTTTPGHEGLALCWPCLTCFYALPYGCQLSGGPSAVVHSWDNTFLQKAIRRRVHANKQIHTLDVTQPGGGKQREVEVLRQLRGYTDTVNADVELLVFSNNNREQSLIRHRLDQPLAEWLRRTMRPQAGAGFRAMVLAHQSEYRPGVAQLAINVFIKPEQVVRTCTRYARYLCESRDAVPSVVAELASLCCGYGIEVLGVNVKDLDQLRRLAATIAAQLADDKDEPTLKKFLLATRDRKQLRTWITRQAVEWTLRRPAGSGSDLFITDDQFLLLFEPTTAAWLHQDLLLISVLERLHAAGWPAAGDSGPGMLDEFSAQFEASTPELEDEQ